MFETHADEPTHTENPYQPALVHFDTARPFLDAYLPELVSTLSFTWDAGPGLSTVYLAQCVMLASHQFGGPDPATNLRAMAWELCDHVRALGAVVPLRQVAFPDGPDRCDCGVDHNLEAAALATFLERAVSKDNPSAVKVLDALWRDTQAETEDEILHVGSSLLTHVVGVMVYSHTHQGCLHGHDDE